MIFPGLHVARSITAHWSRPVKRCEQLYYISDINGQVTHLPVLLNDRPYLWLDEYAGFVILYQYICLFMYVTDESGVYI